MPARSTDYHSDQEIGGIEMAKIPEISDLFLAAADIEAETPITVGRSESVYQEGWEIIPDGVAESAWSDDRPDQFLRGLAFGLILAGLTWGGFLAGLWWTANWWGGQGR